MGCCCSKNNSSNDMETRNARLANHNSSNDTEAWNARFSNYNYLNDTEIRNAKLAKHKSPRPFSGSSASWGENSLPDGASRRGHSGHHQYQDRRIKNMGTPRTPKSSWATKQPSSPQVSGSYPIPSDQSQSSCYPTNYWDTPPRSTGRDQTRAPLPRHGKGKSAPTRKAPGGYLDNSSDYHHTEPKNFKPAYRIKRRVV